MFWRKKIRDTDERGKALPFQLHAETKMEHYRADTFYTKEPETVAWIDGFKHGSIFIDVGANIGVYSLYCAITKPTTQVYAFEPLRENFMRLVDNITLNHVHNIHPINLGLGSESEIVKFYVKNAGIGESGSQIKAPVDEYGNKIVPQFERRILAITLDSFIRKMGSTKPIYLKIDVDGREWDVLRGLEKRHNTIKSVLVEVNTESVSINDVTQKMKGWGLYPDGQFNHMKPHSSQRRNGNPINIVYSRPY